VPWRKRAMVGMGGNRTSGSYLAFPAAIAVGS
jgi:hypothetical protein